LPTTVYEGTKAAASMLVQGYAKAFNLKAIIVRPYCVFGYFSKQNLLIPLIINTILENKSLNIYRGFHDYIYVKDFVRGINILIKNYKKWSSGEIINLGSGKQISNFRVFRVIRKHFGLSGNFSLINKHFKSYDSDMWVGNIQHAYKKYNFRTEYSFEEAVKDIKKYYNFS
jgi:nucleoside-diphosphate-sugar epimerase